jgi:hypothetical protein
VSEKMRMNTAESAENTIYDTNRKYFSNDWLKCHKCHSPATMKNGRRGSCAKHVYKLTKRHSISRQILREYNWNTVQLC